MNTIRIRRKLESETLHLPELRPFLGQNVQITVEVKHTDDLGCFSQLSLPKVPDETEANALRELLSEDQFEALMDLSRRGGPDVEKIALMRSKSMT